MVRFERNLDGHVFFFGEEVAVVPCLVKGKANLHRTNQNLWFHLLLFRICSSPAVDKGKPLRIINPSGCPTTMKEDEKSPRWFLEDS